ncbi:MBL fold metallo-hydrolase [Paenibacillus filicis]|uniref:MBL fold metallo-hydrolase n=1 Tax=Paenibacillus filicis TaxID=669464 RepID=A0ABU9DLQ9_9BACL
MQLDIWGGAGEHGRSSYYLLHNDCRVLLDCGVKKTGSGEYPLIDPAQAARLDAVFLSHAHEDHSVALPLLIKHGYRGPVWTTRATAQQIGAYFSSWSGYVKGQGAELPYEEEHIAALQFAYLEDAGPPGTWIDAAPSVRVCWGRSGHLLGSVWLLLELDGERVFFSGDYTSESLLLAADGPERLPEEHGVQPPIQLSLIDAAYGLDEEAQAVKLDRLAERISLTLTGGGSVLLPVPTFGRGQDLLVWASEQFPDTALNAEREVVDALAQMLDAPEWLWDGARERILRCLVHPHLTVIDNEDQRSQAFAPDRAGLYLTSDGMLQSPRAQAYYRRLTASGHGCVILTGHLAEGSFGQRLLMQPPGDADAPTGSIEAVKLRYKVHQGAGDVRRMLRAFGGGVTVPVHTGTKAIDALCAMLETEGFTGLRSLQPGDQLCL